MMTTLTVDVVRLQCNVSFSGMPAGHVAAWLVVHAFVGNNLLASLALAVAAAS